MDKLREEFEEKLSHDYGDDALLKNSDGDYVDWLTSDLWDYWQASRASIVVDLPKGITTREALDLGFMGDYASGVDDGIEESAKVIRSVGLSIKGE